MNKIDLRGVTKEELLEYLKVLDTKPYRITQVLDWIYGKKVENIKDMTNLPKDLRDKLNREFYISKIHLIKEITSRDGTKKFLFSLEDNTQIESVLLTDDKRLTVCISTQVGCRFYCSFCYTGKMGFIRDLTVGEIINQIMSVCLKYEKVTNIVVMGMGEPLDNYDNVIKAIKIISSQWGLGISGRKITLSTCGIVLGIEKLKNENLNINLAVSLNATENETRNKLMPVNKKYPLEKLLKTCREYPLKPRRRITFEYVLIKNINDSEEDAKRLVKLLKGVKSKINLLPFNKKPGIKCSYETPDEGKICKFHEYLLSKNYSVFIRKSRGHDISASCGQLTGMPDTS